MVEESKSPSAYAPTYERKVKEIFEFLEVDPKKALKLIQKEIETRAKKILPTEMASLKIIKAYVLEKNLKIAEAKADVFGVFDELTKIDVVDHYCLDTLMSTVCRMIHRDEYMARYLQLVESLLGNHPKDKDLVKSCYEGSLKNNKFG